MIQSEGPLQIIGTHKQGKIDKNVEGFWLESQELHQIPHGIESFFPNLKAFYLYDAKLKTVSKDVLQYPSLRYLSLRNNELVTLDVDLFEYTPELEVIRFKLNLIQHVGLHLLSRLDNLTIALFNTNACINRDAYDRAQVIELNTQLALSCPTATTTKAIPSTILSTNIRLK